MLLSYGTEMAESIPLVIKNDIVGYSGVDVCRTGMNFYGPKGFFSPAQVSKSFAYSDIADITIEVNRFAADNVIIHFRDPAKLPFMFQTYKDAGPRIAAAVKELLDGQG